MRPRLWSLLLHPPCSVFALSIHCSLDQSLAYPRKRSCVLCCRQLHHHHRMHSEWHRWSTCRYRNAN
uniref:Putative secreted peptide n=1 Tax=Anopheles braziliensis TaxID=58242 RepID=A0A2M3ZUQ4_9DIPT